MALLLKDGALMARGQAQKADSQLNTTNTAASQYGKQANQLFSALEPQYQQETLSQGYDPATKAAMTTSGMGAIGANIGGTQEDVARRAARTRNPAGVAELTDALSRNKALASGTEAANLQKEFADYENKQRQAGLSGLMGLEGLSADEQARLLGIAPGILQARAAGGGWAQGFHDVLSGLGSLGGGVGASAKGING